MATFQKRGNSWRAIVRKSGNTTSATFPTKGEAQAWATRTENDIHKAGHGIPNKTFGQLLERYATDVSPTKKGAAWEAKRIQFYLLDPLAAVPLGDLDATHFAAWRDRRLKAVTAGTVLRDWNLLSNACNKAIFEWKWLHTNPMSRVKRPAEVPPRDRLISQDEIARIKLVLGDDRKTVGGRVCAAMEFALETAMRTGEIAGLRWDDVVLDRRYCRIRSGKTAAAKREVPLSSPALAIIQSMPKTSPTIFNLTASQISSNFQGAKRDAGVSGFHFHDTRANAITMLARKLELLDLARMIGHKKLEMLRVYYRRTAEDIAGDLD